jgi:endothelin-converting enzyme/putative endopeptidase
MDQKTIESKGVNPLKPELDAIAAIREQTGLLAVVAHLHQIAELASSRIPGSPGEHALFSFGSRQDFHDASRMIANADQGGLGLVDRDYYFKDDAKSKELRGQYVEHVGKMLELAGEPTATAQGDAKTVMAIETRLAKGSLDRVARRDPLKLDHPTKLVQFKALAPKLGFDGYLASANAPSFDSFNVSTPDFFKGLNDAIAAVSIDDWKVYLRWHLIHAVASALPARFVDEDFRFYGKILRGTKEQPARWKRCVVATDGALGEALGQRYVEENFGQENKSRTQQLVRTIERALERDISTLSWMTDATKKRALEKLHAIANKIGYPDKWRDYSSVEIVRDDYLGNTGRARAFEHRRRLNQIGKPSDRNEWRMTPPTVNAYYMAAENSINFPAGILQPPFYDASLDEPVNLGGIGAVIGHELTHGFDDSGRKFDAVGNLENWWTPQDGKEFEKRATCVADEYSSFVAIKDPPLKVNGRLTLGENTADNGGVRVAHMALQESLAGKEAPKIEGFTPEQRLFLAYAQIWCENRTEESMRLQVLSNPHSPGRYRTIGVMQNMPEFQKAFSCKAGQPLVPKTRCRVW